MKKDALAVWMPQLSGHTLLLTNHVGWSLENRDAAARTESEWASFCEMVCSKPFSETPTISPIPALSIRFNIITVIFVGAD